MSDPLEKLILEGGIPKDDGFGPERRAHGDDASDVSVPNTDDELGSDLSGGEGPADKDLAGIEARAPGAAAGRSTRTGPKGVIQDRKAQDSINRANRRAAVESANRRMEGMALSTNTWQEDEKQRRAEADGRKDEKGRPERTSDAVAQQQASIEELAARERRREKRMNELKAQMMARGLGGQKVVRGPNTWFGHLREVDARGYADAIDRTEEGTHVVIHIYSKRLVTCGKLTAALTSLARQYPQTKFLQVQATAIDFGCAPSGGGADSDDEDDEDASARAVRDLERDEQAADVLPTLLVYQAGRLVHNLVRVDLDEDWGRGDERDVRDLLLRRGVLQEDKEERYVLDSDEDDSD